MWFEPIKPLKNKDFHRNDTEMMSHFCVSEVTSEERRRVSEAQERPDSLATVQHVRLEVLRATYTS